MLTRQRGRVYRAHSAADVRALRFVAVAALLAAAAGAVWVATLLLDRAELVERLRDQAAVCVPAKEV